MPSLTPTRTLARFAAGIRGKSLPGPVTEHLKLCILDSVGCGLFGSTLPWAQTVADLAHEVEGPGTVSVWGRALRLSAPNAALANGTATHAFELDDTHAEGIVHLASSVLPAITSVAETRGVDGRTFLHAVAVGYEVAIRVGMAISVSSALRGFHVPAVASPFGAAVGAGVLLDLDETQMLHALGIAGGMAAGLQGSQYGAMAKRMQLGRAAQSGVLAALLAQRGFTGMTAVLDDVEYGGFLRAFSDRYDLLPLTEGLGQHYEAVNVGFKPYACSRSNHTTLDAIRDLRRRFPEINAEEVEGVQVQCSTVTHRYGSHYDFGGVTAAQLSIPYCAAVLLQDGDVFVGQFSPERFHDPGLLDLAQRVQLHADPEIDRTGRAGRFTVRVQVTLKDGRQFSSEVAHPKGSPQNPMTSEELLTKFRTLAGRVLPTERLDQIVTAVERLEECADVREIMTLLVP